MVERAALEMRCTGNCTGGSNPSLSASNSDEKLLVAVFRFKGGIRSVGGGVAHLVCAVV